MPNYNGKSALRMVCPNCGTMGDHKVTRTEPSLLHFARAQVMFEKLCGKDLTFRSRDKTCCSCNRYFETVELSKTFITQMIDEILRLQKVETEKLELGKEVQELRGRLLKIIEFAQG